VARLPRAVLPGQVHLIVHRGHSGLPVFLDQVDRERYLTALRDAAVHAQVALHAYGLLDNEARLLVSPSTPNGLAAMLQATGRRYVRAFNRTHHRSGSPWEGRFRSSIIDANEHFLSCLRFVETAASAPGEEEHLSLAWSSARHHLGLSPSALIREHSAYWSLGNTPFEREVAYRRLVERPIPSEEVAAILRAVTSGWVLGSQAFAMAAQEQTGRRPNRLSPGRPRKAAQG
jgi:putative transposase